MAMALFKSFFVSRNLSLLASVMMAGMIAFAKPAEESKPPQRNSEWNVKMQELRASLTKLIPFLFDDAKFNAKENRPMLESEIKKFYELSQAINQGGAHPVLVPDSDPGLAAISREFSQEIGRANDALKSGHRDYARSVLRSSVAYCISCHTRSDSGPRFDLEGLYGQLEELPSVQKMRILIATRNYDKALSEFQKRLTSPRPVLDYAEFEQGARIALAVSVRVKRDPMHTAELIKSILQSSMATPSLKQTASGWQKSVARWQAESPASVTGEEGLLAKGRELVERAQAKQAYPADADGDIDYMRASSILHDYLTKYPQGQARAEGLFLIGQCYEALKDLGFWTLHERYYEACIKQAPHTNLAVQCMSRLENSMISGYTGSSGVHVPPEIRKQLGELRKIASREKAEKTKGK
jgi:TolA-binding protein